MGENPSRKGSNLICPSCKGTMYVPQVQQGKAADQAATALPQQPAQRRAAPPIKARPVSKQGFISSTGVAVTLIILGIIVVGGGGIGVAGYLVYKASQDRILAQEQRKAAAEAAEIENKKREADAAPFTLSRQSEPTKKDIEALRKAVTALQEACVELDEDFAEALEDAGMERLLVAHRVAKDTDFGESHKIISNIRGVIDIYRKDCRIPMEQWVGDLSEIEFEGLEKEAFMKQVETIRQTFEGEMEKFCDLKLRVVDQYEKAIKHLEVTRGTWKLEGESLTFTEVKDADRYKQFFDEVDKHAQKQSDLLQKYMEQGPLTKGLLKQ